MDTVRRSVNGIVTPAMLRVLPRPVQRYLEYTGVVGSRFIETVYLHQQGKFRLGYEKPWMRLKATESYTVDPPGFFWDASFKVAGVPLLNVRDKYEFGHGRMTGKLAGLITLFDVSADELDQGAMLRYLGEMIWFPTAFLSDYISWDEIDDSSAKVTFTDRGKSVSATMFFDDIGRLVNFTAMRYREHDGQFLLDPWSTPILAYGSWAGLKLPSRGQAIWHLESGDLLYTELEVTELEYRYTP